jgi:hypothetical protein
MSHFETTPNHGTAAPSAARVNGTCHAPVPESHQRPEPAKVPYFPDVMGAHSDKLCDYLAKCAREDEIARIVGHLQGCDSNVLWLVRVILEHAENNCALSPEGQVNLRGFWRALVRCVRFSEDPPNFTVWFCSASDEDETEQ